jgi:hypothetical protein
VRIVAGPLQFAEELRLLLHAFGELALGALVEHGHDGADDFQMAELLGGDVQQHVLAARIVLGHGLAEIAHRGGQLALRPTELFEQQVGQGRIGPGYSHRVLQAFVVSEHEGSLSSVKSGRRRGRGESSRLAPDHVARAVPARRPRPDRPRGAGMPVRNAKTRQVFPKTPSGLLHRRPVAWSHP